jgi:anti-sigma factor RsiW
LSDDISDWDAAYVLGVLSQEDRAAFEAHLAAHPALADSLDELGQLVGILSRLSKHEALALI